MKFGFKNSKVDGTEFVFSAPESLPLPDEFTLVDFIPKAIDQGQYPTCVPCSLSVNINWKLNMSDGNNKNDNDVDIFQIFDNGGDDEGMTFKDAFRFLKQEGVDTNKGKFKINNYGMINNMLSLKYAIYFNGPCVGALPVYDTNVVDFWNKYNGSFEGGHAIAIVGWNKDGFIIRNSWGRYYGDKGCSIIPYDDINYFLEIWTIIQ